MMAVWRVGGFVGWWVAWWVDVCDANTYQIGRLDVMVVRQVQVNVVLDQRVPLKMMVARR